MGIEKFLYQLLPNNFPRIPVIVISPEDLLWLKEVEIHDGQQGLEGALYALEILYGISLVQPSPFGKNIDAVQRQVPEGE